MEKKLIPAPIDEKSIVSDFINDFMNSYDEYRNGHHLAVIGTPLELNQPYLCEWNNQCNWLRFTPVCVLGNIATLADMQRLADEFVRHVSDCNDGRIKLVASVSKTQVHIHFYFTNN